MNTVIFLNHVLKHGLMFPACVSLQWIDSSSLLAATSSEKTEMVDLIAEWLGRIPHGHKCPEQPVPRVRLLVFPVSSLPSDGMRPDDHPVPTCPSQVKKTFLLLAR
ncbi:hypothetical protein PAMP_014611 [Pampus punctatissimus]